MPATDNDTARRPPAKPAAAYVWLLLALFGAWTIVVPYLGRAVGFEVGVARSVEVVDHVVPGTLVLIVGTWMFALARRGRAAVVPATLVGAGVTFLAGFWVLATHVPLVADAVRGSEPWGATLWHATTSLPLLALSLWIILRAPDRDGRRR